MANREEEEECPVCLEMTHNCHFQGPNLHGDEEDYCKHLVCEKCFDKMYINDIYKCPLCRDTWRPFMHIAIKREVKYDTENLIDAIEVFKENYERVIKHIDDPYVNSCSGQRKYKMFLFKKVLQNLQEVKECMNNIIEDDGHSDEEDE
jgi:hypothetical protein